MRVKRRYRRKKVNYEGNRIPFNVDDVEGSNKEGEVGQLGRQLEQCKVEAISENVKEERDKEYSQYK